MTIQQVDTSTLQAQHTVNHKHNTDGKTLHASTSLGAAVEAEDKKSKKKKTKAESQAKSAKTSKGQKLSSVKDDIKLEAKDPSTLTGTDDDSDASGGLYQGFGDSWEPDPLVLFMFENAPVLIELCEKSLTAMTDAQCSQNKLQLSSALQASQDTVAKGQQQAEQQNQKAGGEFAQMGIAMFTTATSLTDMAVEDNTYSKDLDRHDGVMNGLKAGATDGVSATGTVGGKSPTAQLSTEEEIAIKSRSQEFKEVRAEKYQEKMKQLEGSLKSRIKKNNWMGLGRSQDTIDAENHVTASRYASREAFKEVLGPKSYVLTVDHVVTSGDADLLAQGCKVGDKAQIISNGKIFNAELSGSSPKATEMRRQMMQELFTDGSGNPMTDMGDRMDIIGDWGSEGHSLRKEMLKTYGGTPEGAKMRQAFAQERAGVAQRAQMESADNNARMQKRQNTMNIFNQGFSGVFDMLQKQYIVGASNDESDASLNSSMAQVEGQAQSNMSSQISKVVEDLTSLLKWFDQAHGQLVSAQTSA